MSRARNVGGMGLDRQRFAAEAAGHLDAVLTEIAAGRIDAPPAMRARIEGALIALSAVAADDPLAELDALRDPSAW